MNKTLAISVIVLVAVIMVMGAVAPAMAGNHKNVPEDPLPCKALDDDESAGKSDPGKSVARGEVC